MKPKTIFFYAVIALTLFAGVDSVYRLFDKARLPFEINSENNKLISGQDFQNIQSGNTILKIDNVPVYNETGAEFIIDSKKAGESVLLVTKNNESIITSTEVILVDYYSDNFFIIVTIIVGFLYWVTGVYVIGVKPHESSAKLLCLILVTFSLTILSSEGFYGRGSDWPGYAVRILHSLSYIFGSAFFLHFSFIFPDRFLKKQKLFIISLYVFATVFGVVISAVQFIAMRDFDEVYINIFNNLWTAAQLFLLLSIIFSTLILPLKYKRHVSRNEKAQLEWIFWGTALGVSPFIIFRLIPSIFGLTFLIKDEIIITFLALIPVSFGIAVIKYRLFDIDVVIKRSIVYSVLIVIIIFLYLGIIYLLGLFGKNYFGEDIRIFNILTAIIIALIFGPLRRRVKYFVDSVFYKEKYFFDEAISRITKGVKESETLSTLGDFLSGEINSLVPVKSIAIIVKTFEGERFRILEEKNFSELSRFASALRIKRLYSKLNLPFAMKDRVEKGAGAIVDTSMEIIFKRWNINLLIPMTIDSDNIIGAIVLGEKVSGLKYSAADLELLNQIASSAGLAVKRLELQEKLILEELEKTKHKELSELKSYFVATVSHDLKTPLSSIKIFSELLRNDKVSKEKSIEYLGIIEGETDRLGRMINNVLDYARIERGIKKYTFEKIDLNNITENVLNLMSYEFMMQKFEVEKDLHVNSIFINGDADAINSLITNLLSNSIKYSGTIRYIKISTKMNGKLSELEIEDRGNGIPEDDLNEIFNPFFRGININNEENKSIKPAGAGLGLSIVKHILEAHNAEIKVESKLGTGSRFKINFPTYNED